jgi:multiple sugar transport system substrate-binding protein
VKLFFLVCLVLLAAASELLVVTLPEHRSPVPVITWVTQDDPVKRETVALFPKWLAEEGLPLAAVRIDNGNIESNPKNPPKELIQGLAGVGGDLLDIYLNQMELFQATGMLADLTDVARRYSFSPEQTYPNVHTDFVLQGRQYGFPRNVELTMCWINRDTFARYAIPVPPRRWSWDQFEELGLKFVAAANPPGTRQRVFFINRVWPPLLRRGLGLSAFNETLTRCTLDDPRNAEVLRRIYRWTVEERLMPTQDEQYAMVADATGFDSSFALFAAGRFGMIYEGLWALIRLRPRGDLDLAVVEPFTGGFPNTEMGGGAVAVYAGSRHPEIAFRFLQFLTSKPFNMLVARSGDSLPPVPAYAKTDAFLHPPGRPGERGVQESFAQGVNEIGIAASRSPFVLPSAVYRIDTEEIEVMLAGRLSPEDASRVTAERINAEIAYTVQQDPGLGRLFTERQETQRRIEARRAAGQPVPAAWISDPFHLAYYRANGWLERGEAP